MTWSITRQKEEKNLTSVLDELLQLRLQPAQGVLPLLLRARALHVLSAVGRWLWLSKVQGGWGGGEGAPDSKYPLFLGYHVDTLLKKEVFTLKKHGFPKNTLEKVGVWSRGRKEPQVS